MFFNETFGKNEAYNKEIYKENQNKNIRKIVFEIGNPQAFFLCKRKNSQNPNDHLQPRISKNGKKKSLLLSWISRIISDSLGEK